MGTFTTRVSLEMDRKLKIILIAIGSFMSVSCTGQRCYTQNEAYKLFNDNQATFERLLSDVKRCPQLHYISGSTDLGEEKASCDAKGVDSSNAMHAMLKRMQIRSLIVSRRNGQLISIRFLLQSRGLVITEGNFSSIEYITDPNIERTWATEYHAAQLFKQRNDIWVFLSTCK